MLRTSSTFETDEFMRDVNQYQQSLCPNFWRKGRLNSSSCPSCNFGVNLIDRRIASAFLINRALYRPVKCPSDIGFSGSSRVLPRDDLAAQFAAGILHCGAAYADAKILAGSLYGSLRIRAVRYAGKVSRNARPVSKVENRKRSSRLLFHRPIPVG